MPELRLHPTSIFRGYETSNGALSHGCYRSTNGGLSRRPGMLHASGIECYIPANQTDHAVLTLLELLDVFNLR